MRRPRNLKGHFEYPKIDLTSFAHNDIMPYEHGEATTEDYVKKTSLSPWAPVPDAIARRLFDLAKAKPEDYHVDLGSGDGRVNFHAIDYGVKRSLGIDIDEEIVRVAEERLAKRHPKPDLEFVVADLMNPIDPIWEKVQQANILTMYFAEEALEKFRPLLEHKIRDRKMRILTCGYEMPGWATRNEEVILGTRIHLYEWGSPVDESYDADFMDIEDDEALFERYAVASRPKPAMKVKADHTGKWPIRGFDPDSFFEEDDVPTDDEDFDSDDEGDGKKEVAAEKDVEANTKVKEMVEKYSHKKSDQGNKQDKT
jgi:hypothetical protein